MTIANLYFEADRALCMSDTLTYCGGRPALLRSKFELVPSARTVIMARGVLAAQQEARLRLDVRSLGSVEDIVACLAEVSPGIMAMLRDKHAAACERAGVEPEHFDCQFAVVGWSPGSDRFRASHLFHARDFTAEWLEAGAHFLPGDDWKVLGRVDDAVPKMVQGAIVQRQQLQKQRDNHPGGRLGCGGRLELVEMTKRAVRITTAYEYPDLAAVQKEIESGRAERAD